MTEYFLSVRFEVSPSQSNALFSLRSRSYHVRHMPHLPVSSPDNEIVEVSSFFSVDASASDDIFDVEENRIIELAKSLGVENTDGMGYSTSEDYELPEKWRCSCIYCSAR